MTIDKKNEHHSMQNNAEKIMQTYTENQHKSALEISDNLREKLFYLITEKYLLIVNSMINRNQCANVILSKFLNEAQFVIFPF